MTTGKRTDKKIPTGQDATPSAAQTVVTPADRAYRGLVDQDYGISMLMEMQQSIGQVKASVDSLKSSVDGVRGKVDDLVAWKHRIVGGAVVLGAVVTLLSLGAKFLWDHIVFVRPNEQPIAPTAQVPNSQALIPQPPLPSATASTEQAAKK